jgi:hypothetical protein
MRDLVTFRSGPDGKLILAVDTAGGTYDYEDLAVELSGRTIEITTPEGDQPVGLEPVHGDLE